MNDGVLASLKWYYECKRVAREKIFSFKPPANLFDLRFYYTLYFVNLLSAIDYTKDYIDEEFKITLQERLICPGGGDGKNNLRYISALRNALVHRGEDVAKRGSVVNGLVVVHAPEVVIDKFQNQEIYRNAFGYYVLDIIALCEAVIGPTIFEFLEKHKLFDFVDDEAVTKSNFLNSVNNADMPEFAKELARASFKREFYLDATQDLHQSLKGMLLDTQVNWPKVNP